MGNRANLSEKDNALQDGLHHMTEKLPAGYMALGLRRSRSLQHVFRTNAGDRTAKTRPIELNPQKETRNKKALL